MLKKGIMTPFRWYGITMQLISEFFNLGYPARRTK